MTNAEQYQLVAQLGLLEGIKAGAFIDAGSAAAITALTSVTTANATDLATAITLVNALKTKVNTIITALQA